MDYSLPSEGILKKVLGYGYQIEPAALNMLESLGEEKVIDVLDSFSDKFPDTIVIEGKQIEAILEKTPSQKAAETNKFALSGKITQIYDGSGLIQRCPKCNRWIIDDFCMVHSDVEGIWDLRIKARFDAGNGKKHKTLFFGVLWAIPSPGIHFYFNYPALTGILWGSGLEQQFFQRKEYTA